MRAVDGILRAVVALALVLASSQGFAQVTIYSDTFSGNSTSLLNGTGVENDPANSIWSANNFVNADGSLNGSNEGSALLEFNPTTNATYTLSLDVTMPVGVDRWVGLGFSQNPISTPGGSLADDRFSNSGNGISWMLLRDHSNNPQDVEIFAGPGATNAIADNDNLFTFGIPHTLSIILDTTGDGSSFTADFKIDGVSQQAGSVPVTVNQTVSALNFVGFTFDNSTATPPSVDNFLLTELITGSQPNHWTLDGNGNFSNAANWSQGTPANNSDVTFGDVITANRTVTLNSSIQLNKITFDNTGDGDYFFAPSTNQTLALSGDAGVLVSGRHWLRAEVVGTAGLNVSGSGELVLDAANSFSGGISVNDANLSVVHPSAIPSGNSISATNGAVVQFFGPDNAFFTGQGSTGYGTGTVNSAISLDGTSQLSVYDGAQVTFSGEISGGGAVNVARASSVTLSNANSYSGVTTVSDTAVLTLTGSGALGDATGRTNLAGESQLVLNNVAVGNEYIVLDENNDGEPAKISSIGTSSIAGNINAGTGDVGSHYEITSTAGGMLTLSGTLSAADGPTGQERIYVFSGDGNINVTGKITDLAVDANGNIDPDPLNQVSAGDNVRVVKRGNGTLTINTATTQQNDYWQLGTTVEQGTLAVISDGGNQGELWSSTITVEQGATFDVDNFGVYNLQVDQTLGGGGTVVANTLGIFDDNTLSPGDGVGTLTINGTAALSGGSAGGSLNYDLGNTTSVGGTKNDLIQVNGSFSTNGAPNMTLNVTPVEGTLAAGTYRLISHSGTRTTTIGITPQIVSNTGSVLNPRQTFAVSGSIAAQVNLVVSGSSASRTWNGSGANNVWQVAGSTPWTGGDQQFRDLDTVTFGSAASNKTVVVNTNVTPGSTNFSGGNGSTYTLVGTGGITGHGPVKVNNGTVQFHNTGNNYLGTTTVASGARLETFSGSTGSIVADGTLSVESSFSATLIDDFSGGLGAYTNTVILDANGGGSNTAAFQDSGGVLQYNTTAYDGIEQTAYIRSGLSLGVGEEIQVDADHTTASQDIGLYVGGTTPTPGVRQDYIAMYARADGGVLSRGFDGTTEYPLAGGGVLPTFDKLFIARTDTNTYEAGYYNGSQRTVVTTRTPSSPNDGDVVGFYTDVRAVGTLGNWDNLTLVEGSPSSVLDVSGDFTLTSTGTLELNISDLGFTSLDVSGTATLDGTLSVNLINSFMPSGGESYDLLAAGNGIVDAGVTFDLPELTAGLSWDTSNFFTTGVISVSSGLSGDFNLDGRVDGADFLSWQRNPGIGNLAEWQANYGQSTSTPAATAVPEPASTLLLLTGFCGLVVRRSRNERC